MSSTRCISNRVLSKRRCNSEHADGGLVEANWKPLEKVLGKARCAGFMFMGRVNGINLYKHGITRTYLNLDDDGNCYVFRGSWRYEPADFSAELVKLEACGKPQGEPLESTY